MKKDSYRICLHSVEGIATTISKKWAIFILILLGHHGRLRLSELTYTLEGISPKSLADMLKELHEESLIQREAFSEIPPRVEYFLTEDGKQLCEALIPLIQWVKKWDNLHPKVHNSTFQSTSHPSKLTRK